MQRAAALGYAALAITDLNTLAGVVRAHAAAKVAGLKLVIGAEITPHDAPPVALCQGRARILSPVASDYARPPRRPER